MTANQKSQLSRSQTSMGFPMLTILNFSDPGFDIVECQIADLGLEAVEIHGD